MSDRDYRVRSKPALFVRFLLALAVVVALGVAADSRAAEATVSVACVSREVAQTLFDAYAENQEQGEMTLMLLVMLGACEVQGVEPEKTEI